MILNLASYEIKGISGRFKGFKVNRNVPINANQLPNPKYMLVFEDIHKVLFNEVGGYMWYCMHSLFIVVY